MTHLVDAVQKMQDYISTHLDKEITLADLANVALYSPWYCYRIFKEYTGYTPSDYIRRLKLTDAAQKLKNTPSRVLDIAKGEPYGN